MTNTNKINIRKVAKDKKIRQARVWAMARIIAAINRAWRENIDDVEWAREMARGPQAKFDFVIATSDDWKEWDHDDRWETTPEGVIAVWAQDIPFSRNKNRKGGGWEDGEVGKTPEEQIVNVDV